MCDQSDNELLKNMHSAGDDTSSGACVFATKLKWSVTIVVTATVMQTIEGRRQNSGIVPLAEVQMRVSSPGLRVYYTHVEGGELSTTIIVGC